MTGTLTSRCDDARGVGVDGLEPRGRMPALVRGREADVVPVAMPPTGLSSGKPAAGTSLRPEDLGIFHSSTEPEVLVDCWSLQQHTRPRVSFE